eukprot:TRINITY_DN19300_c0_g1_i5.p2 TRINITY_DN19300_c0_g1~~TRINITY_DN19300_c0_g1_i5.p2  ORF type:complete len:138 (-),score=10.95 TRINITY_DN19300_c0_g1_i5:30-443(-)
MSVTVTRSLATMPAAAGKPASSTVRVGRNLIRKDVDALIPSQRRCSRCCNRPTRAQRRARPLTGSGVEDVDVASVSSSETVVVELGAEGLSSGRGSTAASSILNHLVTSADCPPKLSDAASSLLPISRASNTFTPNK